MFSHPIVLALGWRTALARHSAARYERRNLLFRVPVYEPFLEKRIPRNDGSE